MIEFTEKLIKRFLIKIDIKEPNECWNWLAGTDSHGYGSFRIKGKTHTSNRVAWSYFHAIQIPDNMQVLHLCHNRRCCNPNHLYLGTHVDNMADKVRASRQSKLTGLTNPNSKLSEEQKSAVRGEYHVQHRELLNKMADKYEVSESLIRNIIAVFPH